MSDTSTASVELYDEAKNDYTVVTVDFEFSVEETEYEGSYVFYQGGVNMDDCSAKPFTFMGKTYDEGITVDLFPFIAFEPGFLKEDNNEAKIVETLAILSDPDNTDEYKTDAIDAAKILIADYMIWIFDTYVASNITIPTKTYPDSRYG